jgi:CO/xanthine dehydrogenase Mo-binding subunit
MLEARLEDLVIQQGKIFVSGSPARAVTIKEVVQGAQTNGWGSAMGQVSVRPDACPPHFIVWFVEVAVDIETGRVEVVRAVSGADAGIPINLDSVEGQIAGGLHMGLGYGMMEDTCFDGSTGRVLNPNLRDYKMLTIADMPEVETLIAETYEPTGPFGAKGVGEGVTNPVAAAVANAIYNAVGVRVRELPMSAEKILAALKGNAFSQGGRSKRGQGPQK